VGLKLQTQGQIKKNRVETCGDTEVNGYFRDALCTDSCDVLKRPIQPFEIRTSERNVMKRRLAIVALTLCLSGLVSAQSTPTTPSNGDPDSFGHNVIFLGQSGTASVFFDRSLLYRPDSDHSAKSVCHCAVGRPRWGDVL
jgi:hypothetical protein